MSKLYIISTVLLFTLFHSCDTQKETYDKIDPKNKIMFKVNDTLLFKSIIRTDSFIIKGIYDGFQIYDKTNHVENYSVGYLKLNNSKQEDSIYNNSNCYNYGHHNDYPTLEWRNIYDWPEVAQYNKKDTTIRIGSYTIPNVIVLNAVNTISYFPFDVIKVYYCHSFGIIQYERFNKEIFILDSNCIKKYIK